MEHNEGRELQQIDVETLIEDARVRLRPSELGDSELREKLMAAEKHNPATGFMNDCEGAIVLRDEFNRRRKLQADLFGGDECVQLTGVQAQSPSRKLPNIGEKAPITKEQREQLRRDAKDLKAAARRKGLTLNGFEEHYEAIAAKKHFELGCWLKYYSDRLYVNGAEGLEDRVQCLLRLVLNGVTRPGYEFFTVFDFGERHFDTIFEMGDDDEVKRAIIESVPLDQTGKLLEACKEFGWEVQTKSTLNEAVQLDYFIADNAVTPHIGLGVSGGENGELMTLVSWELPNSEEDRSNLELLVIDAVNAANSARPCSVVQAVELAAEHCHTRRDGVMTLLQQVVYDSLIATGTSLTESGKEQEFSVARENWLSSCGEAERLLREGVLADFAEAGIAKHPALLRFMEADADDFAGFKRSKNQAFAALATARKSIKVATKSVNGKLLEGGNPQMPCDTTYVVGQLHESMRAKGCEHLFAVFEVSKLSPGVKMTIAENMTEVHANQVVGLLNGARRTEPRVLITVSGGVADYVSDEGVDVKIFDRDNYDNDPVYTDKVPAHFWDLAEPIDVPWDGDDNRLQASHQACN